MTYMVKQKIRGKTYAYEVESYWDPEKKQARQKRKYLGLWDEETGSIVPKTSQRDVKVVKTFGPTYLLDQLAKDGKLRARLKEAFGEDGDRILALAMGRMINPTALKNAQHIIEDSFMPELYNLDDTFNSQWMSRFLQRIGTDEMGARAFHGSLLRNCDSDTLIYDITSLSSSSRNLSWLEYGYNRDGLKLPQVNLGLVMSTSQRTPVYYKVFPGSINDVVTLKNLVAEIREYGIRSCLFILDRGFYSENNLVEMSENDVEYIIPLPFSVESGKKLVSATNRDITNPANARRYGGEIYYVMEDVLSLGGRDVYAYVIYNKSRESNETEAFYNRLMDIESKLEGKRVYGDHREFVKRVAGYFEKYLDVRKNDGHLTVSRKAKAISQVVNRFGKTILLSSSSMKWDNVMTMYREREEVERQYLALKRDLEAMPLRIQKMETFQGLLFVFFVSLILRSILVERARAGGLLEKQSIEEILLDLAKLRAVSIGGQWRLSEITKRQRTNLEKLGVGVPIGPKT